MRRIATTLEPEPLERLKPRYPRRRVIAMMLLGLTMAPVVYEGSRAGAARWHAVLGPSRPVDTPVLTTLSNAGASVSRMVWRSVTAPLRYLPWKPNWVIGIAAVWVVIGSCLLRKL